MKFSEFRKKYGEGTDFDLDWCCYNCLYLHCSTETDVCRKDTSHMGSYVR